MKVLLQQVTTSLYLKQMDIWTHQIDNALDFGYSERAINFAREKCLADVQVVIAFRESNYAHIIPFPAQVPPARGYC